MPHRSRCSCSVNPAALNTAGQGPSAGSSWAASAPVVPRWKWPGASCATLNGTMPASTRNAGAALRAVSALVAPFCIDRIGVPGGSSFARLVAASAVALLFTLSRTSAGFASAGTLSASTSASAASVRSRPSRSVSRRPCCRRSSRTRRLPTKVTGAPASCRLPPRKQPIAPAPITSTGPGAFAVLSNAFMACTRAFLKCGRVAPSRRAPGRRRRRTRAGRVPPG